MKRSEAQLNGHKRQQIELQYVIWLFLYALIALYMECFFPENDWK